MEQWVMTLTQQGPTGLGWSGLLIASFAAAAAIAGATIALLPPLGRWIVPRPGRGRFSEFVRFERVRDDGVIECRGGWIACVWIIQGMDHQGMTERRCDALYEARRHTLDQIAAQAKADLQLRLVSRRIKTDDVAIAPPADDEAMPDALREISTRWAKSQSGRTYANRHYVVAFCRRGADGEESLTNTHDALCAGLAEYEPRRLDGDGPDGPMALFGPLLSPASKPTPMCKGSDRLVEMVCTDRTAIYPDGRVRACWGDRERWSAVLGLRLIADSMKEQTMTTLLGAECELTVVQSVVPLSKTVAKLNLAREARANFHSALLGTGGAESTTEVYQMVDGSHPSQRRSEIYNYQLAILAHGNNEEGLELAVDEVRRIMLLSGASIAREGVMAESLMWGVIPGYEVLARPWRLLSFPIAASWVPQAGAEGIGAHDWAPHAITAFRSAQGSAFRFTWHPTDAPDSLGHCAVIAPAGAGKTTLLSLLASQTLRIPSAKVWCFDRFNGLEIMTHAMEGAYVRFEGDDNTRAVRLNPLLLDDRAESRAFLRRWLAGLIPHDKTPADRQSIEHAIRLNFELAARDRRRLEIVIPAAFHPRSASAHALERWYADDDLGRIFNASGDDIDGIDHRWVTFDCTNAFANNMLAPVLVQYLMYRIQERSRHTGDPSLIIVDETEPLLGTEEFKTSFKVGLQEGRKLHQVFVCCFQKPSAIETLGIGDLIRGMCPTIIFSPNEQADPGDYRGLGLTDADMAFIQRRTHRGLRHAMLVKRWESPHSAVIDASLAGLGPWLGVFKSGPQDINRARTLVDTLGHGQGIRRFIEAKERTGVR